MPQISDQELNRITKALNQAAEIRRREQDFIDRLGPAIINALGPAVKEAVREMSVTVNPVVDMPEIKIPKPVVNVTVPPIEVPKPEVTVNIPKSPKPNVEVSMPTKAIINELRSIKKSVSEQKPYIETVSADWPKYTRQKPIPALLVDLEGKPWSPLAGASRSVANMLKNEEGLLADFGPGSANTALRVVHASDAALSTSISSIDGTITTQQLSGATDSVNVVAFNGNAPAQGLSDTSAGHLRVVGVADFVQSVNIVSGSSAGTEYTNGDVDTTPTGTVVMGNTGDDGGNLYALRTANGVMDSSTLRVLFATDTVASVNIVSGSSSGTEYTEGATDTTPTGGVVMGYDGSDGAGIFALRTHSGVANSGVLRVVHVNDVGVSVTATQTGTWNIGTVTTLTGITNSVAVVGDIASDVADTESNPIKIGGVARTANPTAVAAGDRTSATFDDLGRQVMRPIQVRDLIKTAYVSVTGGTETTLLAAVAGSFLDCIAIMASNASDAAVSVDVRAVTGGNVVHTIRVPANGTAGWAPPIAWPQDATGNNWTVDGPDETGRTLTFSALFSQEV